MCGYHYGCWLPNEIFFQDITNEYSGENDNEGFDVTSDSAEGPYPLGGFQRNDAVLGNANALCCT